MTGQERNSASRTRRLTHALPRQLPRTLGFVRWNFTLLTPNLTINVLHLLSPNIGVVFGYWALRRGLSSVTLCDDNLTLPQDLLW